MFDLTYCTIKVWDTAGQERFHTITKSFFRGSQGILLVYDVTERKSFDAVRSWMEQIRLVRSISATLTEDASSHIRLYFDAQ